MRVSLCRKLRGGGGLTQSYTETVADIGLPDSDNGFRNILLQKLSAS